jgi:hypothetical protein
VASALGCGLKLHALLFHLAIDLPVLLLVTCKQAATSAQRPTILPCFLYKLSCTIRAVWILGAYNKLRHIEYFNSN